eukprot:GFKZ01013901.1.p1 GENE.GFKZ01013901.1~~GFKZ01013901.1.p1  ORF type:complete len:645 (-),score=40.85 GFKZ01013901.1:658-2592(-)
MYSCAICHWLLMLMCFSSVIAQRCRGRGDCPKGKECLHRRRCVNPVYSPIPTTSFKFISEIQGPSTVSPLEGKNVTTIGIITAITAESTPSLWIQDIYEDDNQLTSEGIFVFRPSFVENSPTPTVGDIAQVSGTVAEFVSSRNPNDLPITEISAGRATIVRSGAAIRVSPSIFNPRSPLTSFGDGSAYEQNDSSPRTDLVATNYQCGSLRESSICHYEAHEHMLVRIQNPRTVTAELNFGEVGIRSAPPSCNRACRLNSVVRESSFVPSVITVEDDLVDRGSRDLGVGVALEPFDGILHYSFSQYKVFNIQPLRLLADSPRRIEPMRCRSGNMTRPGLLRISSWNVLNRDPKDPREELESIAANIASFQGCPDIVALSEIGDNDGSDLSGETSANLTLDQIAKATSEACRAAPYRFTDIAPINLADGGLPGENIRVAFLYREDRVQLVPGAPKGGPGNAVKYNTATRGLSLNPGRIEPRAFNNSRKPLAGEFRFVNAADRQSFIVVVNHWSSKRQDDRLFQRIQPPLQSSQAERRVQSAAVKSFIQSIPGDRPVIVVGDLNDFHFSDPVSSIGLENLWQSVPAEARFSFVFQSRMQTLDHILVRRRTVQCGRLCAPHTSTLSSVGSQLRETDHDPLVAVCQVAR